MSLYTSAPVGLAGADGDDGAPGIAGADGRTVLNGSGAPSNGLGANGDFYIRTSNWTIYGPKSAGAWGSPTSLIGPQGEQAPGDVSPTADTFLKRDGLARAYASQFTTTASGFASVGDLACQAASIAVAFRNDAGTGDVLGVWSEGDGYVEIGDPGALGVRVYGNLEIETLGLGVPPIPGLHDPGGFDNTTGGATDREVDPIPEAVGDGPSNYVTAAEFNTIMTTINDNSAEFAEAIVWILEGFRMFGLIAPP